MDDDTLAEVLRKISPTLSEARVGSEFERALNHDVRRVDDPDLEAQIIGAGLRLLLDDNRASLDDTRKRLALLCAERDRRHDQRATGGNSVAHLPMGTDSGDVGHRTVVGQPRPPRNHRRVHSVEIVDGKAVQR